MEPAASLGKTVLFARVDFVKSAISMASFMPRIYRKFWVVSGRGAREDQTVTWAPSSTTRSEGIEKKSVAFAACRDSAIKSRSCHKGMPELGAGLIVLRPRKNDVVMMSNFKPALRSGASAAGTRGLSM